MQPESNMRPAPLGSSGRSGRGTFRGMGSPVRAAVSTNISSPWTGTTRSTKFHGKTVEGGEEVTELYFLDTEEGYKMERLKKTNNSASTNKNNSTFKSLHVTLQPQETRNPLGRCCLRAGKSLPAHCVF